MEDFLKIIEKFQHAQFCIQSMKDNGTFEKHKIGIVVENFSGMCIEFEKGDIVIFRETEKVIHVEKPLSPKIIKDNLKKGNLITAFCTIVCVPKKHVNEIPDVGYTVIGKVIRVEGVNNDYGDIHDDSFNSKLALPLLKNFLNKEVIVTIKQL